MPYKMETWPMGFRLHTVSPVPRIASAATMGLLTVHASKGAQERELEQDTSAAAVTDSDKSLLLLCPALQLTGPRNGWCFGLWAPSLLVGEVASRARHRHGPGGQNGSQRLLGGPKPSSRLGQRAQRSTVQCPSARRFQSRLSCFDPSFSPVDFFLFCTGRRGSHSCTSVRWSFSFPQLRLSQLRPGMFPAVVPPL